MAFTSPKLPTHSTHEKDTEPSDKREHHESFPAMSTPANVTYQGLASPPATQDLSAGDSTAQTPSAVPKTLTATFKYTSHGRLARLLAAFSPPSSVPTPTNVPATPNVPRKRSASQAGLSSNGGTRKQHEQAARLQRSGGEPEPKIQVLDRETKEECTESTRGKSDDKADEAAVSAIRDGVSTQIEKAIDAKQDDTKELETGMKDIEAINNKFTAYIKRVEQTMVPMPQFAALAAKVDDLACKHESAQRELCELRVALKGEREALAEEIAKIQDANTRLESEDSELRDNLDELGVELYQCQQIVNELGQENLLRVREIMKLEHVNVEGKKVIEDLRKEVAKATAMIALYKVTKENITEGEEAEAEKDAA